MLNDLYFDDNHKSNTYNWAKTISNFNFSDTLIFKSRQDSSILFKIKLCSSNKLYSIYVQNVDESTDSNIWANTSFERKLIGSLISRHRPPMKIPYENTEICIFRNYDIETLTKISKEKIEQENNLSLDSLFKSVLNQKLLSKQYDINLKLFNYLHSLKKIKAVLESL